MRLRKILFPILVVVIVIVILILTIIINHKVSTYLEGNLEVKGQLVEVNGHEMNVYVTGTGEDILIFMSGSGTCLPVLDFKTLYSKLEDSYKIAVVEKAGYGYSETAHVNRDIDTILQESREALSEVGLEGPYIIVAHSMSALEALYWASEYPDEVKAIIGLDPAIPDSYDDIKMPSKLSLNIQYLASRAGLIRFIPSIWKSSSSIKYGNLTDDEKERYKILTYQKSLTINMKEEISNIDNNTKIVSKLGIPKNIPVYFFISDGKQLGSEKWRNTLTNYCEEFINHKYLYVESGHYMHNEIPEKISQEIKEFIEKLNLLYTEFSQQT